MTRQPPLQPVLDGAAFVTFGDSITALSTWPQSVAEALNMRLINAGVGGHTSAHGLWRFERDVAAFAPDVVIISFGSNDFYRPDGGDPRVSLAEYEKNLITLLSKVQALGAVPILMTPPFITEGVFGEDYPDRSLNEALDRYVEVMRAVATRQQRHLIDIHALCDDGQSVDTFLCADGVHLSPLGNQLYTRTICRYMTEHFKSDPTAPRVSVPTAPPLQDGAFARDAISFSPDAWRTVFPDTIRTEATDGALTFTTLENGWPEIHYSPLITDAVTLKVAQTTLTLDMEPDAAANISLFFNGITPTLAYSDEHLPLADAIAKADPSVRVSGADILGGQRVQCTIPFKDIVPPDFIADDGTVVLSGVKLFVIGQAGQRVTIRDFRIFAAP